MAVSAAELAVQSAQVELDVAGANSLNARRDLSEYRRYTRRDRDRNSDRDYEFDPTLIQLRAASVAHEAAFDRAQNNLTSAREHLSNAQESYHAARSLSADALATHENMVRTAQLSTNFEGQQLAIRASARRA